MNKPQPIRSLLADLRPRRPEPTTKDQATMKPQTISPVMQQLDDLTKVFAGARDELRERMDALRDEQEAAKRRRMQGIKNSLERVLTARAELAALIQANPKEFEKPRTRLLHGIRVGWMKQRGKLEIPDEEALIVTLRKMFGDEAAAYIKVTEKPIRDALQNLPARDLAKLGVTLHDDTDAVLIKAADDAIDKMIDALTGDIELESEAERA